MLTSCYCVEISFTATKELLGIASGVGTEAAGAAGTFEEKSNGGEDWETAAALPGSLRAIALYSFQRLSKDSGSSFPEIEHFYSVLWE